MKRTLLGCQLVLAGLSLLLGQCSGNPDQAELTRLQEENEELRSRVEELERDNRFLRRQPTSPGDVLAFFKDDAAQGTLAGLLPGDEMPQARFRFGQENRFRTWTSEGWAIFQYEWDLVGGMVIRINADGQGRLERVAVALTDPKGVDISTLAGLRLGQETYSSLQKKFGPALSTDRQLWGAQGHYTVAQRVMLEETRRLEFLYQMPPGVNPAELDRLGREIDRQNYALLEPHLRDQAPYLIALEEIR